ncbi:MAG: hypothetical protein LBU89_03575 [Fibromonadaceae bacterium]|nr:hypothetical protein [Fibromonadaceae bacterium]
MITILLLGAAMTLQQTVSVTKERRVYLNLPVPENIPIGETEIKIIFMSSKNTLSAKKKNTQSLCGMFVDTGDTLDKFLLRKQAEKQLEYEK